MAVAMSDSVTTLAQLRQAVDKFVAARDWYAYHTPKNLAMSIAIEAAEIMEHFQWYGLEESAERLQDASIHGDVAEEIADVVIYLLSFANATGIDVSDAVLAKLARNEVRFPVETVRGRLG
jgi:NTP pyrophosphatase (non-canonical NTP hydrolase)